MEDIDYDIDWRIRLHIGAGLCFLAMVLMFLLEGFRGSSMVYIIFQVPFAAIFLIIRFVNRRDAWGTKLFLILTAVFEVLVGLLALSGMFSDIDITDSARTAARIYGVDCLIIGFFAIKAFL